MKILELRDDQIDYLNQRQLLKKYEKVKQLFEPKHRLLYSFRLDRKYRALFAYVESETIEIITFTNHYK